MLKRTSLKKGNSTLNKSKGLKRGTSTLKAKKPSAEAVVARKEDIEKMWALFEQHWNSKPHICENCGTSIWGSNKNLYHDHLLEKGVEKYEHLKYDIDNLFLCCWDCHTKKGNGFPGEKHKKAIEQAHIRYGV